MRVYGLFFSRTIIIAASFFLAVPMSEAALYAPGATLDPGCAPTDSNCGVESNVATGTLGQVPYYAANGSILSATSTVTILQNGKVGIGTTTPNALLSIAGSNSGPQFDITAGGYTRMRVDDLYSLALEDASGTQQVYIANSGGSSYINSGNVGIGTTSPWAQLSINPNGITGPAFVVGSSTATDFIVTNGGLVGIGTSNPLFTLDVAGGINTNQYGGYYQAGQLLAYASSTNQDTIFGLGAGGQNATTSATLGDNVAIGYFALNANTTGVDNSAEGVNALLTNSTGSYNVANGFGALYSNISGTFDTASGVNSLNSNTTGADNIADGQGSLRSNITGSNNVSVGFHSLFYNNSATSSVAAGDQAAQGTGNYSNQGGTYVGYQSGLSAATNSNYNTLIGYQSGYNITTGNDNIWLGTATSSTAIANLTTGSQNILIGSNISLPSATNSGQLDIGNIIYGTGNTGTGSAVSSGNIGIGSTSPATKLEVGGSTANVTLDGYLNCSGFTSNANGLLACTASDQRLKQEITPLDASSTLAALNALNPVSFYWKPGTERGPQQQYGLIAQQVAGVFPNLVSTSSPTALTPDGTLTVNYDDLIAPIIVVMQQLAAQVSGFAQSITTAVLNATVIHTSELCLKNSDGSESCFTGDQMSRILDQSGQTASLSPSVVSTSSPQASAIIITDVPPTTDSSAPATTTDASAGSTPETQPSTDTASTTVP